MTAAPLLTPREVEVLAGLASGMTQKEVASSLGISPTRVQQLVASIRRKVGANTTLQVAWHVPSGPSDFGR